MLRNAVFYACLLTATMANAQRKPVQIGVRAGYLYSSLHFQNLPADFTKPTASDEIYIGLSGDIAVAKKISILPEVLYTAGGGVQSYYNGVGLISDRFTHVLLPVLLKYRIGKLGITLGPQLNILTKARGYYYSEPQYDPIANVYYRSTIEGDIKDKSYRKVGYSGIVGLEYVFKYRFGVDARYELGLTDGRASNSASVLTAYGTIHQMAIHAGVFYRFGKRRLRQS